MEISPCKFCGAEGKLEYEFTTNYYKSMHKDNYVVRCTTPDCFASKIYWGAYRTQEEAKEAWNRFPAVEQPRAWPTGEIRLVDRADGCRGHYAIGRMHKSGYVEYWNLRANCWSSCSDDVLTLEQAQVLMHSMSPSVAPAQAVEPALRNTCLSNSKQGSHWAVPAAWRWLYNGKPDSDKCFPMPGPDADIIKAAAKHSTIVQYLYAETPAGDDDTLKLIQELCDLTIINAGPSGMVTAAMKQRAIEIQKRLGVK